MGTSKITAPTGAAFRSDSIRKIGAHLTGERLEKFLDDQRLMLFNVSAILGHASEALNRDTDRPPEHALEACVQPLRGATS